MQKDNFSTLKGEFLPYIIKKQMSRMSHPSHIEATSEVGVNLKFEDDIFQVSLFIVNKLSKIFNYLWFLVRSFK